MRYCKTFWITCPNFCCKVLLTHGRARDKFLSRGPPSVCAGWSVFAPGADAPTWWGGAFDCRSTASVRSEGKPIHRACLIRTRGGCSYRVGVARSIVGAPPRCEAKANQYTEPAPFAPGAGAPTGWG